MISARFRPLPVWGHRETPEYSRRSRHAFSSTLRQTLDLLGREIDNLGGSNVIIGTFHKESEIRLDGWPRSDARVPVHPGVEISFDSRHGHLTYATDVVNGWEGNLRSIALGLEALRAVDRYGVSERGQQYAGWRPLPAGATVLTDRIPTRPHEAWAVLLEHTGRDGRRTGVDLDELIRDALKATHPDTGGSDLEFRRVQAAREILKGTT